MTLTAGRKTADQARDNRQLIWEKLRTKSADGFVSLTLADITGATGVHRRTASDYLTCLVAGGLAVRLDDPAGGEVKWRLERDGGHHAPRLRKDGKAVTQGGGVSNLWRSMRMLGKFSAKDLALHSTTPSVSVSEATAQSYCTMLLATGYLRVAQKADPSKSRKAIYRLVRNSGPKAPMIQRVKRVYDPNTGQVHSKGGDA